MVQRTDLSIPRSHPRYGSLKTRELLIHGADQGIVATSGLIAHGRGEAFDYIIGEQSLKRAVEAERAAVASLLLARLPVISINGNLASLVAKETVNLAATTGSLLEVNLFYRSRARELAIERVLKASGATRVLGIGGKASQTINEISSERRRVDPEGLFSCDVALIPLEDGDRANALRKMGKKVISIDLNPLSRTSQVSSISIIDNIVRAFPRMVRIAKQLKSVPKSELESLLIKFDNRKNLSRIIADISSRLTILGEASR